MSAWLHCCAGYHSRVYLDAYLFSLIFYTALSPMQLLMPLYENFTDHALIGQGSKELHTSNTNNHQ